MKKNNMVRAVLMILLVLIFLFSAYKIVTTVYDYRQGEDHYADLAASVVLLAPTTPQPPADETTPSKEVAPIAVDFSELLRQNSDVVGWIYCENTPISYPVMKSDDYNDYLRRLMNGKYNSAGSIFMDYAGEADLSGLNTVIYGHNMRNNTMFGTLKEYNDQVYYEAHPVFWYLTPNGDYKIELIAGYVTPDDSEAYQNFETEEALQAYIGAVLEKSTFQTNAETGNIDRILTMSTCVRGKDTKRYVLIGRIIPV